MEEVLLEVEALQSTYGEDLKFGKDNNDRITSVSVLVHPATGEILEKQLLSIEVLFSIPENYPNEPPTIFFRNPRGVSEDETSRLMRSLESLAADWLGSQMLFQLTEAVRDCLTEQNEIPHGQCSICLEDFAANEGITKALCLHCFHSHCLADYIVYAIKEAASAEPKQYSQATQVSQSCSEKTFPCPVCRLDMQSFDIDYLRNMPPPTSKPSPKIDIHSEALILQQQEFMTQLRKEREERARKEKEEKDAQLARERECADFQQASSVLETTSASARNIETNQTSINTPPSVGGAQAKELPVEGMSCNNRPVQLTIRPNQKRHFPQHYRRGHQNHNTSTRFNSGQNRVYEKTTSDALRPEGSQPDKQSASQANVEFSMNRLSLEQSKPHNRYNHYRRPYTSSASGNSPVDNRKEFGEHLTRGRSQYSNRHRNWNNRSDYSSRNQQKHDGGGNRTADTNEDVARSNYSSSSRQNNDRRHCNRTEVDQPSSSGNNTFARTSTSRESQTESNGYFRNNHRHQHQRPRSDQYEDNNSQRPQHQRTFNNRSK